MEKKRGEEVIDEWSLVFVASLLSFVSLRNETPKKKRAKTWENYSQLLQKWREEAWRLLLWWCCWSRNCLSEIHFTVAGIPASDCAKRHLLNLYVKACCQRGCGLFNLVDLYSGWEPNSLNGTRDAYEAWDWNSNRTRTIDRINFPWFHDDGMRHVQFAPRFREKAHLHIRRSLVFAIYPEI